MKRPAAWGPKPLPPRSLLAPLGRTLFVPEAGSETARDITDDADRTRCEAHPVPAITVSPDLAAVARYTIDESARDPNNANMLRQCHALHIDASLPSMSWHAGPPRGGVAAALPYASPLAQAMIDISQRCYDAEWLNTLAGDLWAMVHAGAAVEGYGNEPITAEEIANLRALASASGCWCDWSEAEGRPVDVPLGEWLGRFWNVKGGAK